uniref:Uncharacterized protein n=1 Tax=Pipistrellus kuhlii TaxID=59472 RepID=A0A7J7S6D9_PIPKU|nr:hypothetical protein mPipKuh1_010037 [Pipistrellus kuhlii]
MKVQTFAFPASAPSQSHLSLSLGQNLGFPSFLSSLPLEKKKAPTPQGGAADSRGGDRKESKKDHQGRRLTNPWEGRAGGTERRGVKAVPLLSSAIPAHCPGGLNTTKGTGVCGVRSDREKRSRRNEWLKPSEFP